MSGWNMHLFTLAVGACDFCTSFVAPETKEFGDFYVGSSWQLQANYYTIWVNYWQRGKVFRRQVGTKFQPMVGIFWYEWLVVICCAKFILQLLLLWFHNQSGRGEGGFTRSFLIATWKRSNGVFDGWLMWEVMAEVVNWRIITVYKWWLPRIKFICHWLPSFSDRNVFMLRRIWTSCHAIGW